MHVAASKGNLDIVKLLLKAGAKLEVKDVINRTSLPLATLAGHHKVVQTLVEASASLESKDRSGRRILEYAVEARSEDIFEYLLKMHAQAKLETPPRPIFTLKDIEDALFTARESFDPNIVKFVHRLDLVYEDSLVAVGS